MDNEMKLKIAYLAIAGVGLALLTAYVQAARKPQNRPVHNGKCYR